MYVGQRRHLHQAFAETFQECKYASETIGDDYTNTAGRPGRATQSGLKA